MLTHLEGPIEDEYLSIMVQFLGYVEGHIQMENQDRGYKDGFVRYSEEVKSKGPSD